MKKTIAPIYFFADEIEFSVYGVPIAKQRVRVTTRGGFASAYTPKKTIDYENHIKQTYREVIGYKKIVDSPIEAIVEAVFPIPKSVTKKKRQEMIDGKIYHIKKPDCDNIDKSVFDALNDVAYDDDSRICRTTTSKCYGEDPKVHIVLRKIN